jgi:hypothetical protein
MNDGIGKNFFKHIFKIKLSPNWINSIGIQFNFFLKGDPIPMDLNSIYKDLDTYYNSYINQFN